MIFFKYNPQVQTQFGAEVLIVQINLTTKPLTRTKQPKYITEHPSQFAYSRGDQAILFLWTYSRIKTGVLLIYIFAIAS